MQILILSPITTKGFFDPAEVECWLSPKTRLSHATLKRGPAAIESEADEKQALPGILEELRRAEADGMDAVVINCMGDPGVEEGRKKFSIPVIGPGEASMRLAAKLCPRFGIVTILDSVTGPLQKLAKRYGVSEKLVSLRAIGMHVLDLKKDRKKLITALVRESLPAIEKEGAAGIILGCTGMVGCAADLQQALEKRGHAKIAVIDPLIAAIKEAEALLRNDPSELSSTPSTPRFP